MSGTATVIAPDWLARKIPGTRAADVRRALTDLINSGALPPGAQLPTIRALAVALDVKISAVTDAWTMLRRDGLVETRRRGGTRVLGPSLARPGTDTRFGGWAATELANAWPDPALLPDIAAVVAAAVDPRGEVSSAVTLRPALVSALAASWPFVAESFTALVGGRTAVQLAVKATGARVLAVEAPGLVRTTKAMRDLDAVVHSVVSDADGPLPASLAAALAAGATLVMFQPTESIPLGSSLTATRRDALAAVLARHPDTWVLEEDPAGLLFRSASLGQVLPQRTVRITQYWRAFGPDVDLVAVGGAAAIVDRMRVAQSATGLRVGALLQGVVARLLDDPSASGAVVAAGERYRQRYTALVSALRRHGLEPASHRGLVAWIPVADEAATVAGLAASGVRVLAGSGSFVAPCAQGHIRISITRLPDAPHLVEELAAVVAAAAHGTDTLDTE